MYVEIEPRKSDPTETYMSKCELKSVGAWTGFSIPAPMTTMSSVVSSMAVKGGCLMVNLLW